MQINASNLARALVANTMPATSQALEQMHEGFRMHINASNLAHPLVASSAPADSQALPHVHAVSKQQVYVHTATYGAIHASRHEHSKKDHKRQSTRHV